MECPNCKHCIVTNSPPVLENGSTVIPPVEVEEDPENTAIEEGGDSKGPKVPCVVCFVPVTGNIADKFKLFEPLTPEEKECDKLFQWFLLNFRLEISSTSKVKKGRFREVQSWMERFDQIVNKHSLIGWDGQGGKSVPLPFCEECRNEVNGLMERKNGLKSMRKGKKDEEMILKQGILEVTRKMKKCEAEFVACGIYDKDKRYLRVRNDIFKIHWATRSKMTREKGYLEARVKDEVVVSQPLRETRRSVVEVPCIICCETLKTFPDEKKTMTRKAEDMRVFRWFLKSLENPKGQHLFTKRLKGEVTTEFWDGQLGRSEPLQFCGGCRDGIEKWIDVLLNVKTRQERVRDIKKMRERMRECEEKFGKCGIYEKDWRYFNVRRNVIKVLETDVVQVQEKLQAQPQPKFQGPLLQKKMGNKAKRKVGKRLFEKNEMDRILGEGFRESGGEQMVDVVVVKGEEDEGSEQDWLWEEDDDEEEEEPPIIQNKVEMDFGEEDGGMEDPLAPGTSYLKVENEYHAMMRVNEEEDEDMDIWGPHTTCVLEVEGDDLDDNHDPYRNCLLCYKAISKEESTLAPVLTNDLNEQNFNSVFILRKMLNVPRRKLEGYLEKIGCPGKWVEYCKDCLGLVDKALRIQKEISQLEDKLRVCQMKMCLKIKTTSRKRRTRSPGSYGKLPDEISGITEETRQFVNVFHGKKSKRIGNRNNCGVNFPSSNKKNSTRGSYFVPEVTPISAVDVDENGPLESSPPPSPTDDHDFDPSYQDSDSEQVNLKPSAAKELKLGCKVEKVTPKQRLNTGKKFLATLKETGYACTLCPNLKKPVSLVKFYRHLIFHSQRPFKCFICNVYWSGASELEKSPFLKESPSSEHVCSEATLVKTPDAKFNQGEIWECKWCPVKYDTETYRDSHEDLVHGCFKNQMEMEYKCLSCSKGYRSYQEWLYHRVLEHPKVAAISCLFCDFTAAIQTKEGIDILDWLEMKKHTGLEHPACKNLFISLYTCDFCGIPFKCKRTPLESHIKNYHKLTSGRCTFSCSCCHHRTDRLRSLKMHINLRHALEPPPFTVEKDDVKACEVCGKEGLSGVKLMDHKMVKHGLEPEEMEEYTGQEILKCGKEDECGGFRTLLRRYLGVHMRNKHGTKRTWTAGRGSDECETDQDDDHDDDVKPRSSKKLKLSNEGKETGRGTLLKETLNEDEYICSLCPTIQQPMSLGKFYRHLIFHTKRPFRCCVCNVHWSSAKELEKNPFVKENLLNDHVCTVATLVKIPDGKFNPGNIWSCEWCPDKKFDNETERDSHEETDHFPLKVNLGMKYKCLSCSNDDGGEQKGYRSHKEWLFHRVLEHPEVAGISCLFCDFTSVILTKEGMEILNLVEMGKHVNSEHSANKNLFFAASDFCDFCGMAFRYGAGGLGLARHVKQAHKLSGESCTYSCPCCHHRFGKLRTLKDHLNKSHSHDPRPPCKRPGYPGRVSKVICDICGNSLMNRVHLCDHKMNRHGLELEGMDGYKGEKVLSCERGEECGGFRTLMAWNMRDHMMKKHGAERRWKCDQCGKGFTDSSKLSVHKKIHTGLRPYQCEICGNSFAVRNYLYIHKRLSHQNRPFASTNRKRTITRKSTPGM